MARTTSISHDYRANCNARRRNYDFTLVDGKPTILLNRYEKGTRDFDFHLGFALLSIQASNLGVALEAYETFFRRNRFVVYGSTLSDFHR